MRWAWSATAQEITNGHGYTTPAAHENAYYLQTTPALEPVTP